MDIGNHLNNQFKLIRYLAEKEDIPFDVILSDLRSVLLENNEVPEGKKRLMDNLLLSVQVPNLIHRRRKDENS